MKWLVVVFSKFFLNLTLGKGQLIVLNVVDVVKPKHVSETDCYPCYTTG